jgi:simple sugar transport system ATP-binding protein
MDAILEVDGVAKSFGGVHAVQGVSFELYPGEVIALAGDNGAGKSTLIKMIAGVHHPDEGQISYQGQVISQRSPREIRELGIETIYQDLALADNLNIGFNIFLGREIIGRYLGILPTLDRKAMKREAQKALERLSIHIKEKDFDLPVRALSGGQRQAIAISRAVYWQAKVLIMDEPTAAISVYEQREVLALVHRLKEQGVAIIFISHNLREIFAAADRIVVLARGQKAGERLKEETHEDDLVKLMMGHRDTDT